MADVRITTVIQGLSQAQRDLGKLTKELRSVSTAAKPANDNIQKTASRLQKLRQGAEKVSTALARTSASLKRVGQTATQAGKTISTRVGLPIVALGALTLKAAGDFEQGMNRVAAVSGATEEQFVKLNERAKALGATTQFSASQVADAMGFMAQAGIKANDIYEGVGATLKLAAAAQLDLGQSADIVTNIMSLQGLTVQELDRAVDVLTKAFTSANTDLSQLGFAFKFAGGVAKGAGISFEETAAALAIMGNAGFQGTLAGTALRGSLTRLLNPTKQIREVLDELGIVLTTSDGKVKSLVEVVRLLTSSGATAAQVMKLFGDRAGPGMLALLEQGAPALEKLRQQLEASGGTAERIANVQMRGLNGAMRALRSAIESLQIAIGDTGLLEDFTKLTNSLAAGIRQFAKVNPQTLKWTAALAGLAVITGPLVLTLGLFATAMARLLIPFRAFVAFFVTGKFLSALSFLTSRMGILTSAVVVLGFAVAKVTGTLDDFVAFIRNFNAFETIEDAAEKLNQTLSGSTKQALETTKLSLGNVGNEGKAAFKEASAAARSLGSTVKAVATQSGNEMRKFFDNMKDTGQNATDFMQSAFGSLKGALADFFVTGKFEFASFMDAITLAIAEFLASEVVGRLGSLLFGSGGTGAASSGSGIIGGLSSLVGGGGGGGGGLLGGVSGIAGNLAVGAAGTGVGTLGAQAVGKGNTTGSVVGGVVGGVAGSFFGPVGTFVGSALGSFIGGLFQQGGTVPGTGRGDRTLIGAEPGEFVVNRRAAQQTRPLLEAINTTRSFQTGGSAVFTNPSLVSVAETGPERVTAVPLAGQRNAGPINVIFEAPVITGDLGLDKLADMLIRRIEQRTTRRFGR